MKIWRKKTKSTIFVYQVANQVKVVLHSSSAKTDSSIPPAKKNKENSSNNVKADSSLSPPKKKQKLTN